MTNAQIKKPWLLELLRPDRVPFKNLIGAGSREIWASAVSHGVTTDKACVQLVASRFRLEPADLSAIDKLTLRLVPDFIARRYGIMPIGESDRHIFIASCDPANVEVEQAIAFCSGRRPIFRVASPSAIDDAILRFYGDVKRPVAAEPIEKAQVSTDMALEVLIDDKSQTAPGIRLSNAILRDAIHLGVSDIHIEPGPDEGIVRFRIDGVMRTHMTIKHQDLNQVVSRLKVLAKLDIATRHRPQDGRSRVQLDGHNFDLRLSTVPIRDSEKAVIRLLNPENTQNLADVGIPEPELNRFRQLLANRDGILLITGPTGSGKTTTLYGALRELSTGQINIMTVEDPVEYQLKGISQIQVDPRRGVTFASSLRAILRQDPDVIFVGEIRDLETAEMAVQAAMTGHLVLASIHANDAASSITRLQDLGLDRSSIASTLRGAAAQRLMRRICPACAQPAGVRLTEAEVELARLYDVRPTHRAVGCPKCSGTGYRGRIPIMEVIGFSSKLSDMIATGSSAAEISRAAAMTGVRSLRIAAIARVRYGETTLNELHRVLGETAGIPIPAVSTKPRVLLADDDSINRTVARSLLEKNGFAVVEAVDGLVAVERLSIDSQFDLLILDMRMPRLGGLEVLSRLRQMPDCSQLPVIVLTGSIEESGEIRMMELGAEDYIRKPLDPARFMSRVKAVMRRRGRSIPAPANQVPTSAAGVTQLI